MINPSFEFGRIKSGVSAFSNDVFLLTCRIILAALTGNLYYPAPIPSLENFELAINNFSAAMAKAQTGSRFDKLARNEARKVLVVLMKNLADYCTFVAQGNLIILASSGFELAKIPQPNAPLPLPQRFKIANGINSGEFRLSVKGEKLAKMYGFHYTAQETGSMAAESIQWVTETDTKSKYTITGLTPGTKYTMKVTMLGVRGQVTSSNFISQICQ